jgi:hypothetical protein
MTRRPSLRAFTLACAAFLIAATASVEASAQTLAFIEQGGIIRHDQDTVAIGGDAMNRADCDKNDYYEFTFKPSADITGTNNLIHAWVALNTMTDCSQPGNQDASQRVCRQVATPVRYGDSLTITVFVRDIVSETFGTFSTLAGPDVCLGSANPATGTLQFFIVNSSNTAGPALSYPVSWDLVGPVPPVSVKAGVGQNVLVVSWKEASSARDVAQYSVYAHALNAVIDGDAGAAGAPSDGGTSEECASDILIPGQPPPAGMARKGASNGSTLQAEATGLTNGVTYVVAVASVDDYVNPGNLSELACGTPQPVTGFFEAYRAAGGGGGGGFCSIGAARSRSAAVGFVLVALGLMARRFRRGANGNARGAA